MAKSMRLSSSQVSIICEIAKKNFGTETHVWLFGSRVNDQAKGGDIDLYIEPQHQNASDLVTAKLLFLRDLHKKLGEQKIDVVLRRNNTTTDLPIYRIAKETGILLQ
jgi:predicted nucleotidyltransferase